MINEVVHDAWVLPVVCTEPVTPQGGDVVRWGFLTGVAVDDENAAGVTVVDFGQRVHSLSVTAAGAIAVGDTLFYDSGTDALNNTTTGCPFGYAMDIVGGGLTAVIRVLHVPGHGAATLGAGVVSAANLAANAVEAAKINADAVTTAKILAKNVTGAKVADYTLDGSKAKALAADDLTPGIPVRFMFTIADGATADVDFVIVPKVRVLDAHVIKTDQAAGANANTIQIKNGATALSDAMSISGAATGAIVRAASIAIAQWDINAGGTLRITRTKAGGNAAALVIVDAVVVA